MMVFVAGTASSLGLIRKNFDDKRIDETSQALARGRRQKLLVAVFGCDKGRVTVFSEADRGEDR